MTSIPTTPTFHGGTSPQSTLSDISMSSPTLKNPHHSPPHQLLLHNLRQITPDAPPQETPNDDYDDDYYNYYYKDTLATQTVLNHPHLLHRILSNIYDAPSDYQKPSHLIPYDENPETYSLGKLYDLQWVSRYWQEIIYSLNILPFTNLRDTQITVLNTGDTHRLHIPFLTWLGSKMKELADHPTVPNTDFSTLQQLVEKATMPTDGFSSTDFISNPPVSKIWLGFQADFHPPFTSESFKNPDTKKRKAVGCPIGSLLNTVEYSYKIRDRKGRRNDRIMEDAFIISNPLGVTISDVVNHILGVLAGYYRIKHTYMLWMIEIGFPAGSKEVLNRELVLKKRLSKTLFEICNRSARIFLVDSRLEIKNEHRVDYKPPQDFDPFFDPTAQKKRKQHDSSIQPETLKLSMLRSKTKKTDEETDEEEEQEEQEEKSEEVKPSKKKSVRKRTGKTGRGGKKKGKEPCIEPGTPKEKPIKMEIDYIVHSQAENDEVMEEDQDGF
ncbi:hypothetical protein TWF225_006581 [Orbilia oligospora]|nr:hypothetical protein TWF225_006581 [Orbilia oligospora]KAF3265096.1 hypothetical protein TWF217_002746 [Orbilia oligospora]KAF3268032.1 hypothetical protein TWF128_008046 [Orbilia oligospora]